MSNDPTKGPVLDLPPRIRKILTLAFGFGLVLIAAGSLYHGKTTTIPQDKIIHFSAYTLLGTVLMLGLRLRMSLVGLFLLALTSYGIEIIQPYFNRNREFFDAIANTAGVCIGAGLGLTFRFLGSYFWNEIHDMRMNRHLKTYSKGSTLVTEGTVQDKFFVIKSGIATAFCTIDGEKREMATLEPGHCIGIISESMDKKQENTIIAKEDMQVYVLDYETLVADAGGSAQPIVMILQGLIDQLDHNYDQMENILEEK